MFKRILVALDGSAHADKALEEAADLARLSGAQLTLMVCVPELSAWALDGAGYGGIDPVELMRQMDESSQAILSAANDKIDPALGADTVLAHGRPGHEIIAQVKSGQHDLVVMGSRGRGQIRSLALGSVSHEVLSSNPAATLICHDEHVVSDG